MGQRKAGLYSQKRLIHNDDVPDADMISCTCSRTATVPCWSLEVFLRRASYDGYNYAGLNMIN